MADIAPELWAAIERDIQEGEDGDKRLQGLRKRLEQGANDYALANEYSALIGEHISEALQKNLVPGVLPDGKMYYNIAEKTVAPALELAHEQVTEYSAAVIEQIHRDAGMGIKAVKPPIDRDRVDGLVDKVSSYDGMEDASWVLREPIKNFARHSADATAEANAEFVNGLGRQCYIVRIESRPCCKWCGRLAGRYEYPDTPKDVFRRHENCDCQVLYEDGSGTAVDVHTKEKVFDPARRQREIEEKREFYRQLEGEALEDAIETTRYGKMLRLPNGLSDGTLKESHVKEVRGKTEKQLEQDIKQRIKRAELYEEKIHYPELFDTKWEEKTELEKARLRSQWAKEWRRDISGAKFSFEALKEKKRGRIVTDAIEAGTVSKTININKQARHMRSSGDYIEGRSYMFGGIETAQKLIDELSGTGTPIVTKTGEWTQKEAVTATKPVGVRIDPVSGRGVKTKEAMIVYSKTGTHIYPRGGEE